MTFLLLLFYGEYLPGIYEDLSSGAWGKTVRSDRDFLKPGTGQWAEVPLPSCRQRSARRRRIQKRLSGNFAIAGRGKIWA